MKRFRLLLLLLAMLATAAFAADKLVGSKDDAGAIRRFVDFADGTWGELQSVAGNAASAATDSGNPVKVGGVFNTVTPSLSTGQRGDVQVDSRGSVRMVLMQPNAGNNISALGSGQDSLSNTQVAYMQYALAMTFNGSTWDRTSKATTTSRIVSAAGTTNATSAKAAAGTIHCIEAFNASAATKFLKVYNKATAPTVGTDTPVRTIALKTADRTSICFPQGLYLSAGIAYALTGAAADADTTALTAGDVVGLNIDYN